MKSILVASFAVASVLAVGMINGARTQEVAIGPQASVMASLRGQAGGDDVKHCNAVSERGREMGACPHNAKGGTSRGPAHSTRGVATTQ